MKKFSFHFICLITSLFCVCFFNTTTTSNAFALSYFQTNYNDNSSTEFATNFMRVTTHNTPFFKDKNDEFPLFYLPYTYYVKVLSNEQPLCHVECYGFGSTPKLDGYVPFDMLFKDNLSTSIPYLSLSISTINTTILFSDSSTSKPLQYIFKDRVLFYYGNYVSESGESLFYVSYNKHLGYVKESDILPFTINNHPNPLTFIPEPEPEKPPQEETSENNLSTMRIAIFICLCFAGIIALAYIIKFKPKKEVAATFLEDNDYE